MTDIATIFLAILLFGSMAFGALAYPFSAFTFARKKNHRILLWLLVGLIPEALPIYCFSARSVDFDGPWGIVYLVWLLLATVCLIGALRLTDRSVRKIPEITLPMPLPPGHGE